VDKFFKTLAKLVSSIFTCRVRKQLVQSIDIVSEKGKKSSPGWRVGLYFYSPSLSSTRIWQVGEWLSASLIEQNIT
jgi:hypothetical protein